MIYFKEIITLTMDIILLLDISFSLDGAELGQLGSILATSLSDENIIRLKFVV